MKKSKSKASGNPWPVHSEEQISLDQPVCLGLLWYRTDIGHIIPSHGADAEVDSSQEAKGASFLKQRGRKGITCQTVRNRPGSRPSPPLGQLLERHLVRNALIAQHAALGIHALLIGGAIGRNVLSPLLARPDTKGKSPRTVCDILTVGEKRPGGRLAQVIP